MRHQACLLAVVPFLTALACGKTTVSGTFHAGETSEIGRSIELVADGSCRISRQADETVACTYTLDGTQIAIKPTPGAAGLKTAYRGILSMNRKTLMVDRVTWERAD